MKLSGSCDARVGIVGSVRSPLHDMTMRLCSARSRSPPARSTCRNR